MSDKATTATSRSPLHFDRKGLKPAQLLELYKRMLRPRLIEEKMLAQLRRGNVSKWFSGIGQEAVAAGVAAALREDEYVLPLIRNLGVFTGREVALQQLFAQFQSKQSGFTEGRDRSFHFGTIPHHIVGMISHLGPQLAVADGIALGSLLKKERRVTLAFCGDGGTSEGDFHEALNVAAVWELPVIFLVEHNGYALSTPTHEQFRCKRLADRAKGYGMEGLTIEGNNVLEVYRTVSRLAKKLRKKPQPVLLECLTFRMRGHEEASGTKYVPDVLMESWDQKDPVRGYAAFLKKEGVLTDAQEKEMRQAIQKEIDAAWKAALNEADVAPDVEKEQDAVYAPAPSIQTGKQDGPAPEQRFVDAISEGLQQAMEKHDNLVLMGQDIAEYGGVFKVTQGLAERFGKARVRNTPLCESAILGAAVGLSVQGYKSMVEMQFSDFVTCGFNQLVNNMAKLHYRWGQHVDTVIRMPTGAGVGAGPFHSQSTEAWFYHTPGLKVVYPATPEDAKGLLLSAFEDPNPVLYFEHKYLYRSLKGRVPKQPYHTPLGKARLTREGSELTIITYGWGVHQALEALEALPNIRAEVLDLRTLQPLDHDAIDKSVKKTGKALVLHEDTLTGGIGGDIAAYISEHLFEYLDGPVLREASLDTPVPFAKPLEDQFLPWQRFRKKLQWLWKY